MILSTSAFGEKIDNSRAEATAKELLTDFFNVFAPVLLHLRAGRGMQAARESPLRGIRPRKTKKCSRSSFWSRARPLSQPRSSTT